MVPVVTIRSPDVHRIVGIFERINSTGTKLDPVDFMRAITWAEDFDLNHYLENSDAELSEVGIDIGPETIVKCVGMVLGIPPTTDGLLQLRSQPPAALTNSFSTMIGHMRRVAKFLEEHFHILSSNFVPYEGQLLLLFKAVGIDDAGPDDLHRIVRWFWAAGFNESLRGKPDHYVVRAVEDWHGLVRGQIRGLEPRLRLSSVELYERRLVAGGALSATFATMHAANGAKSLITGERIEPAAYMADAYAGWFEPVFSRAELLAGGLSQIISARVFGNVVLVQRSEREKGGGSLKEYIDQAATRGHWDVLKSQFIGMDAVDAMRQNRMRDFMLHRVQAMHEKAADLVGSIDSLHD